METSFIQKIRAKEVFALLGFYLVFSWLYHFTLYASQGFLETRGLLPLFSISDYWQASGMQYAFFFLGSVLLWFIVFKLMRNQPLVLRITVLIITSCITIYIIRVAHYAMNDFLGWGRLRGPGTIWDLYIPALFFFVQFGVLFAYEHYKENQQKLLIEGELRQAALKSELAAIKAQLNPHFLYNVFNTINASVPPKQEKTRQMIATLADLFRYQLRASKTELVPLSDELEFVNKYLELEKARFEERLDIEINVPRELWNEKVPPMLLQPLVENSVKHGISNSLEGGKISLTVFKEDDKLKFEIADTGTGVKDKSSLFGKGIGLSNTQLRLQKMYHSQLEILDNDPQGLKIRFAL